MSKREKRVALVTGASKGIGAALAEYLHKDGFIVYGTSRNPEPVDPYSQKTPTMLSMDITNPGSVQNAVAQLLNREGRIDLLVNNAGLHVVGVLETMPLEEFERCWRTNCLGALLVSRAVVPRMKEQGQGHIINISSVGGALGLPFQGAYSASKFALEGLSESMRAELRGFGIKVVLIQPGDIRHQDCRSESPAPAEYVKAFSTVMKVAWEDEEKGYPPELLGPLVLKILSKKHPRLRYSFGNVFQRLVPGAKRLLPWNLYEKALRLYYKF
jgi:NAD(P)-dependent dehydrogenase (short-subunit alcohol dehydrogenase family)